MYGGILAAHWHQTRLKDRENWHGPFFLAGLVVLAVGLLFYWLYPKLPSELIFRSLAAYSLWLRLGCVVLIFTGISALARKVRFGPLDHPAGGFGDADDLPAAPAHHLRLVLERRAGPPLRALAQRPAGVRRLRAHVSVAGAAGGGQGQVPALVARPPVFLVSAD